MRLISRLLVVVLIVLTVSPRAFADQSPTPANNNVDVGRRKIVIGTVLALTGAFMMPLTSFGDNRMGGNNSTVGPTFGIAMVGVGTGLAVWGIRDRYKVSNPSIVIGTKGRTIFVRRSW